MEIREFSSKTRDLETIRLTIKKAWDELCFKNHWPTGRIKIPQDAIFASIRGQEKIEKEMGENPQWSLLINIRQIAENWNWRRNPAPLQLLQSAKLWEGILQNLLVQKQEAAAGSSENLLSAIAWAKTHIQSRNADWERLGNKGDIKEKLLREIPKTAHALKRLEELTPEQKQAWLEEIERIIHA